MSASDWVTVQGVECVSCPGCAFTFDASHTDIDTGGYTCPMCGATTAPQPPPGSVYVGPDPSGQFPAATDLNPDHWLMEPGLCPGGCGRTTPAGGLCPGCWEQVHSDAASSSGSSEGDQP